MLLLLHIVIAIASLIVAAMAMARPNRQRLTAVNGLAATTVLSGVLLMMTGASILHLCISGLLYVGIVLAMAAVARRRLAVSI